MSNNKDKGYLPIPEGYKGLPLKHINNAIEEAIHNIDQERKGEQLGLFSRWGRMNKAMGKYFRFNHITLIAAPSGHGKSYALNQLEDDFTDLKSVYHPTNGELIYRAVNQDFQGELVWIHFGFEIDAADEVLRNTSRKTGKSYHNLLSSEWNSNDEAYNTINDGEYDYIKNQMNYLKNRPIYYVELTGNVFQIYYTVKHIVEKHPNAKLGIALDHKLLTKKVSNESDMELVSAVSHMMLYIRQEFKAMIIILAQTNQDIKSKERRNKPSLHYPTDADVYLGSQINWICDNIWIFPYRPELIHISEYGEEKIPTDGLVVASCVKSRKGLVGDIYFDNHLEYGTFTERNDA